MVNAFINQKEMYDGVRVQDFLPFSFRVIPACLIRCPRRQN
jgi:hypothetical protein